MKQTTENFYQRNRNIRRLFNPLPVPFDLLVYTNDELHDKQNTVNHIVNIALKSGKVVYERL